MDVWDRIQGCMIGFAFGERAGFEARAAAGGKGAPAFIATKSAMARAVMAGLHEPGRFEPKFARAALLQAWAVQGGKSNSVSLTKSLQDDEMVRMTAYAGNSACPDGGDPPLVRSFPAAIAGLLDPDLAAFAACAQSRLTHAGPISVQAAELFVRILRAALLGMGPECLRERTWEGCEAIAAIAGGGWRHLPTDKLGSQGQAVRTLASALWAVDGASDMADAVARATGLPGHADAIGCVAGALAGAIHGTRSLPREFGHLAHPLPFPDAEDWVRSCIKPVVPTPGPRPADVEYRRFASSSGLQPLTYAGELWIRRRIEAGHPPSWGDGACWIGNYADDRDCLDAWGEGVRVFAGIHPTMLPNQDSLSAIERQRSDKPAVTY